MPRRNRAEKDAPFHHIYFRGINWEPIVRDDIDRQNLLALWDEYAHRLGLKSLCWSLLDTHGHALIHAPITAASEMLQRTLSQYALWFNARWGRRGNLFEDRFKSRPIAASRHARHVARYVLLNPVGAGLCAVDSLKTWPWTNIPDLLGSRSRFRSLGRELVHALFCGESKDLESALFSWLNSKKMTSDKTEIIYAVCTHFGVSARAIRNGSRSARAVAARQAIARELHVQLELGAAAIAKELRVSRATAFRLLRTVRAESQSSPGSH